MPVSRTAHTLLAAALLAVLPAAANALPAHGPSAKAAGKPPARIVFPIVGDASFRDDFGEARGQGGHEGNDILAERAAPVVAVEDGKVRFWTTSSRAGCMLYLYGESGTTYYYIHLNNDLGPGNDNRGKCVPGTAYAPGLKDGQTVSAGQLVAFVGDSGDADGLHPHLHFELRPKDGGAVSPYRWLKRADRLVFATEPALPESVSLSITGRLKGVSIAGTSPRIIVSATKSVLSTGATFALARRVVFTMPARPGADARTASSALSALQSLDRGDVVTIAVVPGPATLRAQIAAPGSLVVDRIVLESGG